MYYLRLVTHENSSEHACKRMGVKKLVVLPNGDIYSF